MSHAANTSGRAGSWTSADASTEIVPANEFRDHLFMQFEISNSNGYSVSLGIGEAAVVLEGVQFWTGGSIFTIHGADARKAIYAINNVSGQTCTGFYQEGDLIVFTY